MKFQSFDKFNATVILSAIIFAFTMTNGFAQTAAHGSWKATHPRRAQVNQRLKNQNRRINQDVKNGTLTPEQATTLKTEDKQIRQEEKTMASTDGGHITKADRTALNQQENAVSKQIYSDSHPTGSATAPTTTSTSQK